MPTHTLRLPGHTARLNQLMSRHWRVKAALKKRDREWVGLACRSQGVPAAAGRRRVTLTVILGPRMRSGDSDNWPKSLLDSLVCAGVLVDDSPRWVEWMPVRYERGPRAAMVVELEDVEG